MKKMIYTFKEGKDVETTKFNFRILNGDHKALKPMVGKVINLIGFCEFTSERDEKDPKTKEPTGNKITDDVIILIDENGLCYGTTSTKIKEMMYNLKETFGDPEWEKGLLSVEIKSGTYNGNTFLYGELV